ncbi:GNAT family N-acetyltransferase [Allokutzneria sp. A3M-2-11 16]|uniref:GNAT family N-acetyltransferase n=1 Tax=Allokutzneria sp. A3M-2-11 16 TaxID=2962043 RepID=UPI0020B82FB3|nr:GNAT family N-acetyltransferase [Allokutzneria sp. A3M-2-11 16]MCP3800384.1 GNAT family N-acetyltransferase [Allokutzneria sp. A3M-2-11 16]
MASTGGLVVRAATRADLPRITAVLGRAFQDDPVMAWMFPGDGRRRRQLPRFFALNARDEHFRLGGIEVAERDSVLQGAGLHPGEGTSLGAALPGDLLLRLRLAVIAGGRTSAVLKGFELLEAARPRDAHWYGRFIGADPDRTGKGVGARLLRSVVNRCDAKGLPLYFETSNHDSIRYFERLGCEVHGKVALPNGPELITFWREPR